MTSAIAQLNLGCSVEAEDDSETTFYLKTSFPESVMCFVFLVYYDMIPEEKRISSIIYPSATGVRGF